MAQQMGTVIEMIDLCSGSGREAKKNDAALLIKIKREYTRRANMAKVTWTVHAFWNRIITFILILSLYIL